MKEQSFGDTALGEAIGVALIILALGLGIGGCQKLSDADRGWPPAESREEKS